MTTTRLSQIETRWSLVFRAHQNGGQPTFQAQRELLEVYAGAVYRYLLAATNNPHVSDDLTQEFALRFLRGDFHRTDPGHGHFRNYVRRAVRNLLIDFQRKQKREVQIVGGDLLDLAEAEEAEGVDLDGQFLESLREEILGRAWEKLHCEQTATGSSFFTVLNFRVQHPSLRSHEMAPRLGEMLGKDVNAGWVRQTLKRARARFVEILRAEVRMQMGNPTEEEIEDELRLLGLSA